MQWLYINQLAELYVLESGEEAAHRPVIRLARVLVSDRGREEF